MQKLLALPMKKVKLVNQLNGFNRRINIVCGETNFELVIELSRKTTVRRLDPNSKWEYHGTYGDPYDLAVELDGKGWGQRVRQDLERAGL